MTRSNNDELPIGCYLVALALVVAFSFVVGYWRAGMEAAAFERVTGKKVSTWDAMFIELRVDESPKDGK